MVFTVRFNHTPSATLGLTAIDATLDVAYYLLGKCSGSWSSQLRLTALRRMIMMAYLK